MVATLERRFRIAAATDIQIEKGVPIPQPCGGRPAGESKYPFADMAVGDSIYVSAPKSTVNAAIFAHRRRTSSDRRFVTRSEGNGYRIWRIA